MEDSSVPAAQPLNIILSAAAAAASTSNTPTVGVGVGVGVGGTCHIECAKEQSALVQCMDQIQRANYDDDVDDGTNKGKSTTAATAAAAACLEPSVSLWIECCRAVNVNERHAST